MALALLAFAWFRARAARADRPSPSLLLIANLAGAGATLFLASSLLALLFAAPFHLPDPLLGGFATMSLLGVLRGTPRLAAGLIGRYCPSAARDRAASDNRAVRAGIELLLAFAYGVAVAGIASLVENVTPAPILLVALVAFLPLLQSVVEPWLVALTTKRGDPYIASRVSQLQDQLDQLTQAAGVSSMRFLLIPGNLANAYAMGVGPSTFVLIGEGLVNCLSHRQLDAVMAHEIGHVARRHTWQLLVLTCFCAIGFALVLVAVFALWDEGRFLLGGILAAAAGAGITGIRAGLDPPSAGVRRRLGTPLSLLDGPTVADSLSAMARVHNAEPKTRDLCSTRRSMTGFERSRRPMRSARLGEPAAGGV